MAVSHPPGSEDRGLGLGGRNLEHAQAELVDGDAVVQDEVGNRAHALFKRRDPTRYSRARVGVPVVPGEPRSSPLDPGSGRDTGADYGHGGAMSTSTSTGTSFWKILAIVIGVLILISIGWSLVKAFMWLVVVALVIVGAFTVFKAFAKS